MAKPSADQLTAPSEPRAQASGPLPPFDHRHASTAAYIDFIRPRCVELARAFKKTGSLHYCCEWHGGQYVKVRPNRVQNEIDEPNRVGVALGHGTHRRNTARPAAIQSPRL